MGLNTKGKIVSIVINNEFIKICEVTKGVKNIVVHKEVTIPVPSDSYFDGAILDINTLSKALRMALDDNRINTSNAVFSITSTKIATKEVVIPNIKANKIEGLIHANAAEYFPVNIDEYIVQHSILEKVEVDGAQKLKILVMAAPAKMIDQYYQLAAKISLKVECIDYIGNSTSQALRQQIGNETSVVIQVENDSTIVNIFENAVLQLQRTIPYGKSIIINDVVEKENMDYEAVYAKLQNETYIHSTFDGDALTQNLQYLVSNINRVMDYYTSRNTTKTIEKAYILGGATHMKGFVELMTNELHVQLINIKEFKDVITDKKTFVDDKRLVTYISNIGALMAPVNFIPATLIADEKKKDTSKFYAFVLIGSVVIAICIVAIPMVGMFTSKLTRDSLQTEVNQLKDIESIVNEYYDAKDMAEDGNAYAELTVNHNDSLQNFITVLEEKMPSDVSITSMNVTSGAVTVSGTALSKSSVAKLILQLQSVDYVHNVNVASETEAKDSTDTIVVTFSLTCSFVNSTEK